MLHPQIPFMSLQHSTNFLLDKLISYMRHSFNPHSSCKSPLYCLCLIALYTLIFPIAISIHCPSYFFICSFLFFAFFVVILWLFLLSLFTTVVATAMVIVVAAHKYSPNLLHLSLKLWAVMYTHEARAQ